jgi:flagellar FliL protein
MTPKKPAPAAARAVPAAAPAAESKAPPKKKRGLIVPVLAVLFVLCAGGAGAWHYLRLRDAQAAPAAKTQKSGEQKAEPVFLALDQFTVNLTTVTVDHYLQVGLTLEIASADAGERVKRYMPVVRSRILLLLASKTAEDLGTSAGKRKLIEEILHEARAPLPDTGTPGKGIENAHFSSFVIQ